MNGPLCTAPGKAMAEFFVVRRSPFVVAPAPSSYFPFVSLFGSEAMVPLLSVPSPECRLDAQRRWLSM